MTLQKPDSLTLLGTRTPLTGLAQSGWDAVVIGGGITGAGILLEAARRGLRVLLLEQRDFAWGSSSRSSKMIHGGLRYIAQGELKLTRDSLQERERLLHELPQLVERLRYVFPIYKGSFPGRWPMTLILALYDRLAGVRDREWLSRDRVLALYPGLQSPGLKGAVCYSDALTDDARLVIRVLQEAMCEGASARSYTRVVNIESDAFGAHLTLLDSDTGAATTINTRIVFNATGAWADQLSGSAPVIRPQRGSHLFVSAERLPVRDCLSFMHPDDGRPVFVFPWKGQTCIGTTDLDHPAEMNLEPVCSAAEIDYLLDLVNRKLPTAALARSDLISTMAGVRPIIASGTGRDPSRERRNHLVWQARGVISVSGGKLTTFRQIALDALLAASLLTRDDHQSALQDRSRRCFSHAVPDPRQLSHPLLGVTDLDSILEQAAWILDQEMVVHLDDLMLRRLRVGNLLKDAGLSLLPQLKPLCLAKLGWSEALWQAECERYTRIIAGCYRA